MAFLLKANESVEGGVKRIVCEQVKKALVEIDDNKLPRHKAVHQVRKRCKKIRAVVRLVRPILGQRYAFENAFFRNTARELSDLRDEQVMLATCDRLIGTFSNKNERLRFTPLRRKLAHHCQTMTRDVIQRSNLLETVRARLCESLDRMPGWKLETCGFDAIEDGLLRTYARGRKAKRQAYEQSNPDTFHNWRKRVKYHRYHIRLLRNLWPAVLQPLRKEMVALSSMLGEDHDLAVFRKLLTGKSDELSVACDPSVSLDLIDQRSADLQRKARPLGERVFAEKPKQLGTRFRKYWKTAGFPE